MLSTLLDRGDLGVGVGAGRNLGVRVGAGEGGARCEAVVRGVAGRRCGGEVERRRRLESVHSRGLLYPLSAGHSRLK